MGNVINLANLRSIFRYVALTGLATIDRATGAMATSLEKPRVQFLYLHHVNKEEVNSFRKLLSTLSASHEFIGYSEAVKRVLDGDIKRPAISISLDDGLESSLGAAAVAEEFGARLCYFICPNAIENPDPLWITEFCRVRLHLPQMSFMTWGDVEHLLQSGHEIGSHTLSHVRLSESSPDQIQEEVQGSYQTLTRRIGQVRHFAWPYGTYAACSPEAVSEVFRAGFESCASAVRGCHVMQSASAQSLCIRRDHITASWPALHALYFLAKNARGASEHTNAWPPKWRGILETDTCE